MQCCANVVVFYTRMVFIVVVGGGVVEGAARCMALHNNMYTHCHVQHARSKCIVQRAVHVHVTPSGATCNAPATHLCLFCFISFISFNQVSSSCAIQPSTNTHTVTNTHKNTPGLPHRHAITTCCTHSSSMTNQDKNIGIVRDCRIGIGVQYISTWHNAWHLDHGAYNTLHCASFSRIY